MAEPDQVIGSIWLKVEISTFFAYICIGCFFMFLRALKEHEVKKYRHIKDYMKWKTISIRQEF